MGNKDPKNRNQDQINSSQDYFHTMLSVLSQKDDPAGTCLDPELLAAFSEGRLRGKDRRKIMAHLNGCPSCRRQWSLVRATMDEMKKQAAATWLERVFKKVKNLRPRHAFAGGGLGLALAACLLLVLYAPQQDNLSRMISDSYATLSPDDIARFNAFVSRGGDEDWKSPPSKALLAYKAGVAAGQAQLLNQSQSPQKNETDKKLYSLLYAMGEWAVLLQCACISTGPAEDTFWSRQKAIAAELQNELHADDASEATSLHLTQTVTHIQNAIKQTRATGAQADGCADIASAMEGLEKRLRLPLAPAD
jgi:hypothetical protein